VSCSTSWANPVSGDWDDAGKWTNGVPDSTKTACILVAGTYTVTLHGHRTAFGLTLGGSSGTQTLQLEAGGGFGHARLDLVDQELSMGADGVGANGHLVLTGADATGHAMLTAFGGTLWNEGTISVETGGGNGGRHWLGGVFNSDSGTVVFDEGLSDFGIGPWTNRGSITVAAGETVRMGTGDFTWTTGTITNHGTLEKLNGGSNTRFIAESGTLIGNPITISAAFLSVGGTGSAAFDIRGANTVLQSNVAAGYTLNIRSGATSGPVRLLLAGHTLNFGTITLTGDDALWPSTLDGNGFILTNAHTGTVVVEPGGGNGGRFWHGSVVNTGTVIFNESLSDDLLQSWFSERGSITVAAGKRAWIGALSSPSGTASMLTDGTYEIAGTLAYLNADIDVIGIAARVVLDGPGSAIVNQFGADALADLTTIHAGGGLELKSSKTVALSGPLASWGFVVVDDGATLDPNDVLTLRGGTLSGIGTVAGSVANRKGTVRPGSSPGILDIAGDYSQASGGTLELELDGLAPGSEHDRLAISGTATFGGTLSLVTGFVPAVGDTFQVVTYDSESGADFDTILGESLPEPPDTGYLVTRGQNALELTVGDTFDIAVTKVDSDDPVELGASFEYTITVQNVSTKPAPGVQTRDRLPSGVAFESVSTTQGSCAVSRSRTVTCTVGTLAAQASATITIWVHGTAPGRVTNVVTATASGIESSLANNSDSESTRIRR
jgi:uncharacterized repeat protein (TIGR01451 family)